MAKDKCVLCGVDTQYEFETHVDYRYGYVDGVGQVCKDCFNKTTPNLYEDFQEPRNIKPTMNLNGVTIPFQLIYDTPNDQQLGEKIREIYNKNA